MLKKLLTLNDLYSYFSSKDKSCHFDYKESDSPIVVQVSGKVRFENDSNPTEGLLPVTLQSCHIGKNLNGSNIEESVMQVALPSFKNRPILGYIHTVDGQPEFYTHNMHEDEEGNVVYDEVPVGIIPESCNAKLVYDKEKEKTYVVVNGLIFEEYSKAAEILEREEECFVSVELCIRELSYNAKEKFLDIKDFYFSGVTILGKNEDGEVVNPGMSGSNIKLKDFSMKNNSMIYQGNIEKQLSDMQGKIDDLLSRFNTENNLNKKEGGNGLKFKELLEKYSKTEADITFETEGLSDEELEAKFEEMFGVKRNCSVNENEDGTMTLEFELSHDDIRYGLNQLISVYRNDEEWCYVGDVYDDYFIMYDWDSDKLYKQSYSKDGDNLSLTGERIQVFQIIVTESEKIAIEEMRTNYAVLEEKVKAYEARPEKEAILNSKDYECIQETEDFKAIQSEIDKYSVEELTDKLDKAIAKSVKAGTFSLTKNENKPQHQTRVNFAQTLSNKPEKNSFLEGLLNK